MKVDLATYGLFSNWYCGRRMDQPSVRSVEIIGLVNYSLFVTN